MKRSRLKKKSKGSIRKIQDEIWQLCRNIVFKRHGDTCYTCGALKIEGRNKHCGHLLAKASLGAYLKYDLRVLRPQCYHCNINCGGQGAIFIENLRRDEGNEYVDQILKDRQITVKAMDHYLKIREDYRKMVQPVDIEY